METDQAVGTGNIPKGKRVGCVAPARRKEEQGDGDRRCGQRGRKRWAAKSGKRGKEEGNFADPHIRVQRRTS